MASVSKMPCVYPVDAWRARRVNESGKRGIVFNSRDGLLDMYLQVPCGKCVGCARDQAQMWMVRCYHESTQHERNCFVTLTYAEDRTVLSKRDLQLFWKRLRKLHPLRYFVTGEYGTKTHRPHYHAIVFGLDFRGGSYSINEKLYGNPILDSTWGLGHVVVADATPESMSYVAGYCNKKLGDSDTFSLMSRRPGIGHTWLDKYRDDIVRTGKVVINGTEFLIPSRYLAWYEQDFEALVQERRKYVQSLTPSQRLTRSLQLRAREITYKSRLSLQQESI